MHRRVLLIAAAGALVALVAARAVLPWLLSELAIAQVRDRLAASLTLEDVDLSIMAGVVAVEGVSLAPLPVAGEAVPLLEAERLEVDLSWPALAQREIDLERVALAGLRATATRDARGAVDLLTLLTPVPAELPAEPAQPAGDAPPWPVSVRSALLEDIALSLSDAAGARQIELGWDAIELSDLQFVGAARPQWRVGRALIRGTRATLSNADGTALALEVGGTVEAVSSEAAEPGRIDVTLTAGEGEVHIAGAVTPTPLAIDLRLELDALALRPLLALAPTGQRALLRRGRARGELGIRLAADQLTADGTLEILDVEAAAEDLGRVRTLALAWPRLALDIEALQVSLASGGAPPELRLASLDLERPLVQLELAPAAEAAVSPPPGPAAEEAASSGSAPAASQASAPRVRIAALTLSEGRGELRDTSLSPAVELNLDGIELDAKTLRWPRRKIGEARLLVGGLGAAPVQVAGHLGPERGDVTVSAERVDLVPFAPYLRRATPYGLAQGWLSLDGRAQSEGPRTSVVSEVVLHALDIEGAGEQGAFERRFGMPLDMALVLLRDPAGDITLDVPFDFDERGTDVAWTGALVTALRRSLVNALSAPLQLVTALLPGRGASEGPAPTRWRLACAPGGSGVPEASLAALDPLVDLLRKRQGLALRIAPVVTAADRAALGIPPPAAADSEETLAPAASERLGALARQRVASVGAALATRLAEAGLDAGRASEATWSGQLAEGEPGVELRLSLPKR